MGKLRGLQMLHILLEHFEYITRLKMILFECHGRERENSVHQTKTKHSEFRERIRETWEILESWQILEVVRGILFGL